MKHKVTYKIGSELDRLLAKHKKETLIELHIMSELKELRKIPLMQLAAYLVNGYEYPKTKEEVLETFVEWFASYDNPPPNPDSYALGRYEYRKAVEHKLEELGLGKRLEYYKNLTPKEEDCFL